MAPWLGASVVQAAADCQERCNESQPVRAAVTAFAPGSPRDIAGGAAGAPAVAAFPRWRGRHHRVRPGPTARQAGWAARPVRSVGGPDPAWRIGSCRPERTRAGPSTHAAPAPDPDARHDVPATFSFPPARMPTAPIMFNVIDYTDTYVIPVTPHRTRLAVRDKPSGPAGTGVANDRLTPGGFRSALGRGKRVTSVPGAVDPATRPDDAEHLQRIRGSLDILPVAAFLTDGEGRIVACNARAGALLGWPGRSPAKARSTRSGWRCGGCGTPAWPGMPPRQASNGRKAAGCVSRCTWIRSTAAAVTSSAPSAACTTSRRAGRPISSGANANANSTKC